MAAAPQNRRVLVVDDDRAAREALRQSLGTAGYDAEGISIDAGLTPELVEVLRPGLVLVDEAVGGERRQEAMRVVVEARRRVGARLLLMGAGDMHALAARARELGADGHVAKARLLADPGGALRLESSLVPPAPAAAPNVAVAGPSTPPPLPPRPPPPPDILAMIDEELAQSTDPSAPPLEPAFDVTVDLFSEHNFYLAKTATGQQVGLFVATSLPPAVGTKVHLTLRMPSGKPIRTLGEVTWVRPRSLMSGRLPAGAGVRMLELDDGHKASVKSFLSERAPYTYGGQ